MTSRRRPRLRLIRLAHLSLIIATSAAESVSLQDFQRISITNVPSLACINAYSNDLSGCTRADFRQGTQCSISCAEGVEKEANILKEDCSNVLANTNSLLGIALDGGLLNALCPGFPATTVTVTVHPTYSSTSSLTRSQTSEASTTAPASTTTPASTTQTTLSKTNSPSSIESTTTQAQTSMSTSQTRSSATTSAADTTTAQTITNSSPTSVTVATSTQQKPTITKSSQDKPLNTGGGSPFDNPSFVAGSRGNFGKEIGIAATIAAIIAAVVISI
ncbi:hypothetical protein F5Y16DRAFT_291976 [Xylariaceae sp. FL0255]|nr:hypothetical protein F5Y16DRAFT_291976 [Xylariaceae sp. FL0255]